MLKPARTLVRHGPRKQARHALWTASRQRMRQSDRATERNRMTSAMLKRPTCRRVRFELFTACTRRYSIEEAGEGGEVG